MCRSFNIHIKSVLGISQISKIKTNTSKTFFCFETITQTPLTITHNSYFIPKEKHKICNEDEKLTTVNCKVFFFTMLFGMSLGRFVFKCKTNKENKINKNNVLKILLCILNL